MRRPLAVSAIALLALSPAAGAQTSVAAVLPGHACMMLNLSEAQMRSGPLPPVLSAPSPGAARLGVASGTVIATDPPRTMNGYVRVKHLDGRDGWVEAARLRRWRSESDPKATCTPVAMPDGRPGFR